MLVNVDSVGRGNRRLPAMVVRAHLGHLRGRRADLDLCHLQGLKLAHVKSPDGAEIDFDGQAIALTGAIKPLNFKVKFQK